MASKLSTRMTKQQPNLAFSVRVATEQGRSVVGFLTQVLMNTEETTTDRLKAADMLLNRGWGRAPVEVHIQVEETITLKSYSIDELISMRETMKALEASEVVDAEFEVEGEDDA